MRIYKSRHYVLALVPGLSGFQRWDEREYHIVTGRKAARERTRVVAEWTPCSDEQYRLSNGRVPEHQPVANPAQVLDFLRDNPYQCAVAIGKAHERLHARRAALANGD